MTALHSTVRAYFLRCSQVVHAPLGTNRGHKFAVLGVSFVIAIVLRGYVINTTPYRDAWIDLCIYIDGGQLVSRGINPYDHTDGQQQRAQLRTDEIAFHEYVSADQGRWDYYASSNLPLSLVYYGLIEWLVGPDPRAWRWIFALSDSLLSVVITYYIVTYWPTSGAVRSCWGILLGSASPLLLGWGTALPEDKGGQILLMVAALSCARATRSQVRYFAAPALVGMSIAFKGLGAFIAPLCLYYAVRDRPCDNPSGAWGVSRRTALFLGVAGLSCLMGLLPFGAGGVLDMMSARLSSNLGSVVGHGSLWRYFLALFPDSWEKIRWAYLAGVGLCLLYGIWRRRVRPEAWSAIILLWFAVVLLQFGSMDRMHIGVLVSLLLLGSVASPSAVRRMLAYYWIGGLVIFCNVYPPWTKYLYGITFVDSEYADALFCLGFTVLATWAALGPIFEVRREGPRSGTCAVCGYTEKSVVMSTETGERRVARAGHPDTEAQT